MGGDLLVSEVAGDRVEEDCGDAVREVWESEFDKIINEVSVFEGALQLLEEVRKRDFRLVLASSGKSKHVEQFLDLIDVRSVAEAWVTSDDVDASKPEPDLVHTALEKVQGRTGILIGDSIWDCAAAHRADTPTIALQTGGFSPAELRDAGAVDVFESLVDLREHLDETQLRRPEH